MKEFKTSDGRIWRISYDLATIRRIRDAINVDLLTREGLQKTASSILDFGIVLYASIKSQADQLGVTEDEFLVALEGVHDEAVDAWLKELEDFFRRVGKSGLANLAGATVRLTREEDLTTNQLIDKATADRMVSRGSAIDRKRRRAELDRILGENPETLGQPSGSSPSSPASIPGPSD